MKIKKQKLNIPEHDWCTSESMKFMRTLLNGNHLTANGQNVKIENHLYYFLNTCPFDSFFEILVDIYHQNIIFKNYVKKSQINETFKLLHDYIESG